MIRRIFTFAVAALAVAPVFAARPLLVGHRGSLYGLENSVESFTNGALRGYDYLETDFKVTADKQFVCTHDDDLSRLGGDAAKTIAGTSLADLQAMPLSQTRSGVQYTGRLCSGQEYLDVCKQYNVKPLIELKWATGINNNDCSNIPLLVKFLEDNGFRNKCIILTSMKPCLEYIRTNYPDIELQFLTGQYWSSHFDWCVQQKIDVDIQTGYFDANTVKKYHDAGLKVNMWTENTPAGYQRYGNMGCDFITTDYLDGKNLPELDPSVTFPPNLVDYPELDADVKGSYDPEKLAEFEAPAALAPWNVRRALMRGGVWHVLCEDPTGLQCIQLVDAATGTVTGALSMTDVNGRIGDIAYTADGVLLACTVSTVAASGGGDSWRVYRWDNDQAIPTLFVSHDAAVPVLGNWSNSVAGEVFAVSGKTSDLKMYVSTRSSSSAFATATWRIAGITVKDGAIVPEQCFYCMDNTNYTGARWGNWTMTVTPSSRNNIIIDSPVMQPVEYTFDWAVTRVPMTEYAAPASGVMPDAAVGISYHRRGQKVYALLPGAADNGALTARMYDVTGGLGSAQPVSEVLHQGLGTAAPVYSTTAFEHTPQGTVMHLFSKTGGMASYLLSGAAAPDVPQPVKLELKREWIMSNTTGNHPGNIDGTNAQQGTAVNGLFYVNNCVDKKIYVFDSNGLVGDMPGGAGWGCARDDAGNIVVRNDKNATAEHSFIIYPAGCTPSNPGTPVEVTVTVPVEGQTNFINASGNLLGDGGHIWLYPNKADVINIISMANGAVTGTQQKGKLNFVGSTAGYVIPVDDDTENWIYQVRGNGLVMYSGGTSTGLAVEKSTTTAPGRNSTGGGAYFKLCGNTIFAHSSGANYKGGFTVRNLTTNEVVANIDPIGALGYETGGNYSTFNWVIAERRNESSYTLYQYCPANGIAVYTLRNTTNAVDNIATDEALSVSVTCVDGQLVVSGTDVHTLEVFNAAGTKMANGADISALAHGMYIVRINGTHTAKVVR